LAGLKIGDHETTLYEHSVAVVTALTNVTGQTHRIHKDRGRTELTSSDARAIFRLAQQLRYADEPWDKSFNAAVVSLTLMTLDGLEVKHQLDIRSSVKDVLKSGTDVSKN
jgi:hypothetical protein